MLKSDKGIQFIPLREVMKSATTHNPIMDFVQVVCRWMIKQGYFEEDAEAGMLIWRGGSDALLEECNLFRGPKGPIPSPLRE